MLDGTSLDPLRAAIRAQTHADEATCVRALIATAAMSIDVRRDVAQQAASLVERVRAETHPTMMESFLAEYGLSTDEGIGLMCLAEALLRVPDAHTIDDLIADKVEPGDWSAHLGASSSSMVNAATWALMLTGRVLDDEVGDGPVGALRGLVRRVGEPVVRTAVGQAMRILGDQFVLGETIETAMRRARAMEERGYTYSYDMLGEAARTRADADAYAMAYRGAIAAAGERARDDVRGSPGVSIKLSALHPRYEYAGRERVMDELVPVVRDLARRAADAGIGLNIDAEEANRLDISLDVIQAVLAAPETQGWDGFGVVVQAYGKRALAVIDWLDALAEGLDRRIMVRLVKGAYWDTEIKLSQSLGQAGFPVFTRKEHTDISYIACARRLLAAQDRIYAQFATHNAHTVAAIRAIGPDASRYEFQRLHGMGEALHEIAMDQFGTRCRIYAPVGAHKDLLAYLVRRLLENGANSSFVNQIVDLSVPAKEIAHDPFDSIVEAGGPAPHPAIRAPQDLFAPRHNSRGYDINEPADIAPLQRAGRHRASACRPRGVHDRDLACRADDGGSRAGRGEQRPALSLHQSRERRRSGRHTDRGKR